MDGIIRVTPRELSSAATEFSAKGTKISTLTNEMTNKVVSLSSVWEGEAATAYVNKFKGLEDDIQMLIRMINEHATDLQEMATSYEQAERKNQEETDALETNVIR